MGTGAGQPTAKVQCEVLDCPAVVHEGRTLNNYGCGVRGWGTAPGANGPEGRCDKWYPQAPAPIRQKVNAKAAPASTSIPRQSPRMFLPVEGALRLINKSSHMV